MDALGLTITFGAIGVVTQALILSYNMGRIRESVNAVGQRVEDHADILALHTEQIGRTNETVASITGRLTLIK